MDDVLEIAVNKKRGLLDGVFHENETLLLFFVIFAVMYSSGCLKGISQETLLLFFVLLALVFNDCTIC